MKKHVLIVATIASFVDAFEKNDIAILQKMGYTVHVAANFEDVRGKDYFKTFGDLGVVTHHVDFFRSPYSLKNLKTIKQLRKIIEEYKIKLVHCHTPVGGVMARIAANKYRADGCKVIYTVHGLQFCKGESMKNWVLFYPVEKILSRFADIIITINNEDYNLVRNRFLNKTTEYIPGVGIKNEEFEFCEEIRNNKRAELGLKEDEYMIFSSGELTKRKNHSVIIRALKECNDPKIHYYIAGDGPLGNELTALSKSLNLESRVHLLGYREDIHDLLQAADIFAFPSLHEGLGISLVEAMSMGLPCVASSMQGILDLIQNKEMLFSQYDYKGYAGAINKLISDKSFADSESENNKINALKFDVKETSKIMKKIYKSV